MVIEVDTAGVGASPRAVVGRLRETFATGRTRDLQWRRTQLTALIRLLEERGDDLAAAIETDLRRPPLLSRLLDVSPVKAEAEHALTHLASWAAADPVPTPLLAQPGRSRVEWEPLGVVLVIAPWNYPIQLALTPVVSALAAGNCVVLKPSEVSPACSAALAALLPSYLDADAVAVLEGDAEITRQLLDAQPDHCFFTGGPQIGKAVMRAAAEHLTPVTLELGGKCPTVVTSSAKLESAARRIAFGKVTNSGQTCVAPDYVLVEEGCRDEFVGRVSAALTRFCQGRPLPIVNARHTERLAGLLSEAGGRTVLGGGVDLASRTVEPTVILDPDPGSALMTEEIFGPILPVLTVSSLDEAIARIQQGTRPLASYLFSEDRAEETRFLADVVAGAGVINQVIMHLGVPELPFGGVGTSGFGRYHGHWGFQTFSNAKAVLRQTGRVDLPLMYPPYGPVKQALLQRLIG